MSTLKKNGTTEVVTHVHYTQNGAQTPTPKILPPMPKIQPARTPETIKK